jgi:hypothetical protein
MKRRVGEREWVRFQWPYVLALLGGRARVDERAYETGAFFRRREIRSPSDLLQLILMWAVAECSLRETAALAAEAELADVSNVALLKRFSRASDWLTSLLTERLAERPQLPAGMNPRIRVIDATAISGLGSLGTDLRVHLAMQLGTNRSDSIELTDEHGAESLDRFLFQAGEIVLADSGYARKDRLARTAASGAYFIVRHPWSTLPLETPEGVPFDLFASLRSLPEAEAAEFKVQVRPSKGQPIACRLVAIRRTEVAASEARQRALASSKRHGAKTIDARTLEYAGYICVLSNAPPELSAASILDLFRLRWQIELKFKNLKSVLHLADVPTKTPELLKVYVLAKLLVATVIEDLIAAGSFFPWGYPIPTVQLLAAHPVTA